LPSRDDIRLAPGFQSWSSHIPEIRVDVTIRFDDEEQQAIPELFKIIGMDAPPPLDDGCVTVHWSFPPGFDEEGNRRGWGTAGIEPSIPGVRSWLLARKRAIRAWVRKQSGMKYELLSRIGGLSFFPQDRNLRERVIGDELTHMSANSAAIEMKDADPDGSFDKPRPHEALISDILDRFSRYASNRESELPNERNWQKRVQDAFGRICAPKEYVGYLYREDDPLGAPVLKEGDYQYPLRQAASGEQVVLEYITRLTWPTPAERNVVLIDEPEIHLHPDWIRKLDLALPTIGSHNQYILTTHSLELRNRAAADNALVDLGALY
jgi:hypothetical protein